MEKWFDLKKRVSVFLKPDNTEAEKKKLIQYTEMPAMTTSGYESMDE